MLLVDWCLKINEAIKVLVSSVFSNVTAPNFYTTIKMGVQIKGRSNRNYNVPYVWFNQFSATGKQNGFHEHSDKIPASLFLVTSPMLPW